MRVSTIIAVGSFLLFLFSSSCRPDNLRGGGNTLPATLIRVDSSIIPNSTGFYMATPRYVEPASRYPLIICFHGAGAYGADTSQLDVVLTGGIPKMLLNRTFPPSVSSNGRLYSFIVIAPRFISTPTNADINAFINLAIERYPIDTSRIYAVGLSVGGRVATDFSADNPQRIAAVVAMAGCTDREMTRRSQNVATTGLPLWAFHNRQDLAWPVQTQITFNNAINSRNPLVPAQLTIFEESTSIEFHDAWTRATNPAYKENGRNIYEWMLQYSRR